MEAESQTRRYGVTWLSQPEGRAHTPLTGKAAPMLFFLRGVWSTRVSPWRRLLGSQKQKRRVRTNPGTNGERWLPASGVQVAIGGRSLPWLAGPPSLMSFWETAFESRGTLILRGSSWTGSPRQRQRQRRQYLSENYTREPPITQDGVIRLLVRFDLSPTAQQPLK